jgi:Ca-activated chloride channel family protein
MRADFSLDYDVLTVEQPKKVYLLARFEAGPSPGDSKRRPLNLSLVIDRSGSMAGDKIDYTRQAAQFLVQHLGTKDMFSVVLYNDRVETLLEPQHVKQKDRLIQLLERIRVRGTTNLSGGWLQGCQHVKDTPGDNMLNRVLLMTDGLANRGITDENRLLQMARQKYEEGVNTTTMGLGEDFNEDLLMDMANAGGGAFYFIESPEVAPDIFSEELRGLLSVVGQNLNITLDATPHVQSVRQLNAYPRQQNTYQLGDIFGDEVKTLVLELTIPRLSTLGPVRIAKLHFAYDEVTPDGTRHQSQMMDVMVNVQAEGEPLPPPDEEVEESVLLLRAAKARQDAVKKADAGEYEEASRMLQTVADDIESASVKNDRLAEERTALQKQADNLSKGEGSYNDYSRKTMQTQSFYTQMGRHDETRVLRLREERRDIGDSKKNVSGAANIAEEPRKREDTDDQKQVTLETELPSDPNTVREVSALNVPREEGVRPTHVTWKNRTFALTDDLIRVGRSPHNEIAIDSRGVSRFHAHIRRRDDTLYLEDLGSTNGTTLNGSPINSAEALSVGDVAYLSQEKLVFHRQSD